jgi:hypothetical protein
MTDPTPDRDEVERRLALVVGRYGARLEIDQLQSLRRTVEAIVEQVSALRAVPLVNSDEPLPRFVPSRAGE